MDLQDRVTKYWSERAEAYGASRLRELEQEPFVRWQAFLREAFGEGNGHRALDVGTGSGFLAVILASLNYQVTGIDLSDEMLSAAKSTAEALGCTAVDFRVMDARLLTFPAESFDLVISRNVTWTLPEPEKAYSEWYRVLKQGGILLNIDGNQQDLRIASTEKQFPDALAKERQALVNDLEISRLERPKWDFETLFDAGFQKITVYRDFSGWASELSKLTEPLERAGTFAVLAIK